MAGAPESPEEATNVTPLCPSGVTKLLSKLVSLENSLAPQLIDTATTFDWLAANRTAVSRLVNEASFASTSRMLALGAMAWAHSTSRAISLAQPLLADGI